MASIICPVLTECKRISPLVEAENMDSSLLSQDNDVIAPPRWLMVVHGGLPCRFLFLVCHILTVLLLPPAAM